MKKRLFLYSSILLFIPAIIMCSILEENSFYANIFNEIGCQSLFLFFIFIFHKNTENRNILCFSIIAIFETMLFTNNGFYEIEQVGRLGCIISMLVLLIVHLFTNRKKSSKTKIEFKNKEDLVITKNESLNNDIIIRNKKNNKILIDDEMLNKLVDEELKKREINKLVNNEIERRKQEEKDKILKNLYSKLGELNILQNNLEKEINTIKDEIKNIK